MNTFCIYLMHIYMYVCNTCMYVCIYIFMLGIYQCKMDFQKLLKIAMP